MKLSELFSKVCKEKSYSEKQEDKMYTAIEDKVKENKKINGLEQSKTWLDEAKELKRINSGATTGDYINFPNGMDAGTTTTAPGKLTPWGGGQVTVPYRQTQPGPSALPGEISSGWEGWLGSFAKKAGKVLAKIGFVRNKDEGKFGLKIDCNIEIDDIDVGLNENTEKVINEYFDRLSIEIKNEITWRKSLAMLLISGEKQKDKDKEDNK